MGVEIYLVGTLTLFCSYKSVVLTAVSTKHVFPPPGTLYETHGPTPATMKIHFSTKHLREKKYLN